MINGLLGLLHVWMGQSVLGEAQSPGLRDAIQDELPFTSNVLGDSMGPNQQPPPSPEPGASPPLMPIRVLASVIQHDGRLLVCRRPLRKRHGGLWEFPGGKVKDGESDLEAARRELLEELGVHVTGVGSVELSVKDPGSDFVIEFLPVTIQGEPQCLEHVSLEWKREEDLLSLALAPSDRRYVMFRLEGPGREGGEGDESSNQVEGQTWKTGGNEIPPLPVLHAGSRPGVLPWE